MGAALSIRGDMPAEELRRLARLEGDGRVACRLIALANALDGMSRERAAKQAGHGPADAQGLGDPLQCRGRRGSGRSAAEWPTAFLGEGQMAAFTAIVRRGPDPERDGVSGWAAKDLCRLVEGPEGEHRREAGRA